MKRSLGPKELAYPLPAFLIGTYDAEGKPNIMTAAWAGICSSEPPSIAISIRPSRWTHDAILQRASFTVNIPSTQLVTETDYAGLVPGKKHNKFLETGLNAVRAEFVDAPYVDECPVVLECKLTHHMTIGSHTQCIGEIMDVKVDDACLSPDGKPDIARIDPLLFDAGQGLYFSVGKLIAQGFAIGKTLKTQGAG